MSPLLVVGILLTVTSSLADVKHVLEQNSNPSDINNLATKNFWWMNQDSPLKSAYDYYKKCQLKGNCLPPVNKEPAPLPPCAHEQHNFQHPPQVQIQLRPQDLGSNPFLNGGVAQSNAQYNGAGSAGAAEIDLSKNPFFSQGNTLVAANGEQIGKSGGFLGVQPAQPTFPKPFSTSHPLDSKKPFSTKHPIDAEKPGEPCKGTGVLCVARDHCVNGVVNNNGEGLIQVRSSVQYCKQNEVCCNLKKSGLTLPEIDVRGISAGKSSIPESLIKFNDASGFSSGTIQVLPNPNVLSDGETGSNHYGSSTSKPVRDTNEISASANSISPTIDYSDTKFGDVRFASTIQGPAYLPPVGGPTPPTNNVDLEVPRPGISTYQPSIPTTRPQSYYPSSTVAPTTEYLPPSPSTTPQYVPTSTPRPNPFIPNQPYQKQSPAQTSAPTPSYQYPSSTPPSAVPQRPSQPAPTGCGRFPCPAPSGPGIIPVQPQQPGTGAGSPYQTYPSNQPSRPITGHPSPSPGSSPSSFQPQQPSSPYQPSPSPTPPFQPQRPSSPYKPTPGVPGSSPFQPQQPSQPFRPSAPPQQPSSTPGYEYPRPTPPFSPQRPSQSTPSGSVTCTAFPCPTPPAPGSSSVQPQQPSPPYPGGPSQPSSPYQPLRPTATPSVPSPSQPSYPRPGGCSGFSCPSPSGPGTIPSQPQQSSSPYPGAPSRPPPPYQPSRPTQSPGAPSPSQPSYNYPKPGGCTGFSCPSPSGPGITPSQPQQPSSPYPGAPNQPSPPYQPSRPTPSPIPSSPSQPSYNYPKPGGCTGFSCPSPSGPGTIPSQPQQPSSSYPSAPSKPPPPYQPSRPTQSPSAPSPSQPSYNYPKPGGCTGFSCSSQSGPGITPSQPQQPSSSYPGAPSQPSPPYQPSRPTQSPGSPSPSQPSYNYPKPGGCTGFSCSSQSGPGITPSQPQQPSSPYPGAPNQPLSPFQPSRPTPSPSAPSPTQPSYNYPKPGGCTGFSCPSPSGPGITPSQPQQPSSPYPGAPSQPSPPYQPSRPTPSPIPSSPSQPSYNYPKPGGCTGFSCPSPSRPGITPSQPQQPSSPYPGAPSQSSPPYQPSRPTSSPIPLSPSQPSYNYPKPGGCTGFSCPSQSGPGITPSQPQQPSSPYPSAPSQPSPPYQPSRPTPSPIPSSPSQPSYNYPKPGGCTGLSCPSPSGPGNTPLRPQQPSSPYPSTPSQSSPPYQPFRPSSGPSTTSPVESGYNYPKPTPTLPEGCTGFSCPQPSRPANTPFQPQQPSYQPSPSPGPSYQPSRPTQPQYQPSRPSSPNQPTPGYPSPSPSIPQYPSGPPQRPQQPNQPSRPTPTRPSNYPSPYHPSPTSPPAGGYSSAYQPSRPSTPSSPTPQFTVEYLPPSPTPGGYTPNPSQSDINQQYLFPPQKPVRPQQSTERPRPPQPTLPSRTTYLPPSPRPDNIGANSNYPGDRVPLPSEGNPAVVSSCAAALKCVEENFCSADGIVSATPVVLTKEQELLRVPTSSCQLPGTGAVGKCCRDANYVDAWPSANLVNGIDDGKYAEDDNIGQYRPNRNARRQRLSRSSVGGPRQSAASPKQDIVSREQTCGTRHPNGRPKGEGPLDVTFAEIPWQAMILRDSNRSLLCGGAIIRSNAVLTAAHCVEGLETRDILIKGGEWKLGIDEEPLPFQIVKVAAIIRHPEYQRGSLQNDLAILVLEEKLRLARNIGTICLPPPNQIPVTNCIATGWGKRILQLHARGALMHSIPVNVMDNRQCQEALSTNFQQSVADYNPNTLCGFSDIDQCKVDYGSALACSSDGQQYTLSGIFSWDTGCRQQGQIGGYIAPDVEWIQNTLSQPLRDLKKVDRQYAASFTQ